MQEQGQRREAERRQRAEGRKKVEGRTTVAIREPLDLLSFPSFFAAGVAKLVYAPDSKTGEVKLMSVRVRPPAPNPFDFRRKSNAFERTGIPFVFVLSKIVHITHRNRQRPFGKNVELNRFGLIMLTPACTVKYS